MGGLSGWHWLIVLVVVLLVFGTKRLRGAGRDLGEAIKGFKKGLNEEDRPVPELDDPSRKQATQSANEHNKTSSH